MLLLLLADGGEHLAFPQVKLLAPHVTFLVWCAVAMSIAQLSSADYTWQ
jgi:hypothetical protein